MWEKSPERVSDPLILFTSCQFQLCESLENAYCHWTKCYMPLTILWHTCMSIFFRIENVTELPKLQPKIPAICHFRNKKGTEAEMLPAVVFVIIAADALVSYWSLFFLSLETRSHSNGPIPFSFVKWWIELVTPRCSDYSPVSRKTGGCFPEAVTYAGPEKSPIWLSGTSRFSCWASKIFNLPCPMCKGGFRQVIWYNNHQLRQASTGPGLAIKNMWELLLLRISCNSSFFQVLIWTFEVEY